MYTQYVSIFLVNRRNFVEPGIAEMLDRMKTGRFKVASHLRDWWEEFRMYLPGAIFVYLSDTKKQYVWQAA